MRSSSLAILLVSACGFSVPGGAASSGDAAVTGDAPRDDAIVTTDAPAGSCTAPGTSCMADVLSTCTGAGATPSTQTCAWGCIASGTAHCGQLVPTGGAVVPGDLTTPNVGAVQLSGTVNTMTGSITNLRAAGAGVISGIGFTVRNGVGIFTFQNITINGAVTITGGNAAAFVARDSIVVDAAIELGATSQEPGPGGRRGGNRAASAMGGGGGTGGTGPHDDSSGGGGGGHGALGGAGGRSNGTNNPNGGAVVGGDTIATLTGGGGGGGGGGPTGGVGGGGGGALQLVAGSSIEINMTGGINAGGAGGAGSTDDGGGGGGAGGAILLEARTITIAGSLAVNGGGGGGSDGGTAGADGLLVTTRASGGDGLANGGQGGAAGALGGGQGGNAKNAGGGGGAVGRIRINTRSGNATITGSISPSPTEIPSATSVGAAVVQ
jgi:hypothetical protein